MTCFKVIYLYKTFGFVLEELQNKRISLYKTFGFVLEEHQNKRISLILTMFLKKHY